MSRMTIVHLGVVVFAICLSTQVVSQNNTSMGTNYTSNPNMTTTMAPETYSSSANSTTATGAGVSLHAAGTLSFLIPLVMAASFLQRYC